MVTDDLVVWLRGVLDEEEAAAKLLCRNAQEVRRTLQGKVERMAAGVLADIAAKRGILDLRDAMAAGVEAADGTMLSGATKVRLGAYDNTIRLVASVYADRPGYREEWRPQ